jgi:hypothetical protein
MLLGPFAVRPSPTTELRPDALVARTEDLTEEMLPVAPVLAVEVLSPSITVFELVDGRYEQVAEVKGADVLSVERPFPVRVVPEELVL